MASRSRVRDRSASRVRVRARRDSRGVGWRGRKRRVPHKGKSGDIEHISNKKRAMERVKDKFMAREGRAREGRARGGRVEGNSRARGRGSRLVAGSGAGTNG